MSSYSRSSCPALLPVVSPAAVLEEEQGREVHEYILRLIAQQHDMLGVLRLMCLSCLCDGGFKSSVYKQYKHELVQVRVRWRVVVTTVAPLQHS